MKKLIIVIFLFSGLAEVQSQDYYISFTGSGASNTLDIIKVNNLMTGATVILNGDDILHLGKTVNIKPGKMDDLQFTIFPNPMLQESNLTIGCLRAGNVTIRIMNPNGKIVFENNRILSLGTHHFVISGLCAGIYLLTINQSDFISTQRLVSLCRSGGLVTIHEFSSELYSTANRVTTPSDMVDMHYNDGDQLIYKGSSSIYSTIVPDVPTGNKTVDFNLIDCTDADSNHYAAVQIGTQVWMAENLNVGTRINGHVTQANNSITEKYCYNDNEMNCSVYGGLYQWDEAMQYTLTPGVQGICPGGWHLPEDAEWTSLMTFLGGEDYAGGAMKEKDTLHWAAPNGGATNSSGFTALPGGMTNIQGDFTSLSVSALYWSSTENPPFAWLRFIDYSMPRMFYSYGSKICGYAVRCVKN